MIGHGLCKLFRIGGEVQPCCRTDLFPGVCPCVAVMEVYHQPHPEFLCAESLCEHVASVAPAVFGIYPHPQTYGIHSDFLHQGSAFHVVSVGIIEDFPFGFEFRHPAYVRPESESCAGRCRFLRCGRSVCRVRFGRAARKKGCCGNQCRKHIYRILFHDMCF